MRKPRFEKLDARNLLTATLFLDAETSAAVSLTPRDLALVGDYIVFSAEDALHGRELWRSDGTAEGTQLLKDIAPGPDSSAPTDVYAIDSLAYFQANDQWWSTDGTPENTQPLAGRPRPDRPRTEISSGIVNGVKFLVGDFGTKDITFFTESGSESSTESIVIGSRTRVPFHAPVKQSYQVLDDHLYVLSDGFSRDGGGLWRSDGTIEGTHPIASIDLPGELLQWNGKLYFYGVAPDDGMQLWHSDGTTEGTKPLTSIASGNGGSDPHAIAGTADAIYFATQRQYAIPNQLHRFQPDQIGPPPSVWRFDDSGRTLITELPEAHNTARPRSCSETGRIQQAFVFQDQFYFVHDFDYTCPGITAHQANLWASDGTSDSAQLLVRAIRNESFVGTPHTWVSEPAFVIVDDQLIFSVASDGDLNDEPQDRYTLGTTDGTVEGTQLRDTQCCKISSPTSFQNQLYYISDGQLIREDEEGQATILTPQETRAGRYVQHGTTSVVGDKLFFTAMIIHNGVHETVELWVTDGTQAGTRRVGDHIFDTPKQLTAVGDSLLFFNRVEEANHQHSYQLWKTSVDGNDAQPVLPQLDEPWADVIEAVEHDGKLYFIARQGTLGGLWVSDGTAEGTIRLADVHVDLSFQPYPRLPEPSMAVYYGQVYFQGMDDAHGSELWRTDGTLAGTVLDTDIHPGPSSSEPGGLTVIDDAMYFAADDGVHGREIWSVQPPKQPMQGDLNGDGCVDFADFLILSANFGSDNVDQAMGDLNTDDRIDLVDYQLLAENYGHLHCN